MLNRYEFDQIITSDGVVVTLTDYVRYFSWGFSGRGMPTSSMRTERGPFQHGDTILGYVLRPRTISFVLRRNECSREEYWNARAELMDILRPNRHGAQFDIMTLRKILPNGSMRDIRVIVNNTPDFEESRKGTWDEFSYQEALRFIAHDPIFYDPVLNLFSYKPAADGDSLAFPITFPIQFSVDDSIEAFDLSYNGTWETFPNIIINGPINEPSIRNITTGDVISLDYNVPEDVDVSISLEYGNKTIVDSSGNNLIGLLTSDSDLASFSLAAIPRATDGINSIGVGGYGITSATEIIFRYFTRYIGV